MGRIGQLTILFNWFVIDNSKHPTSNVKRLNKIMNKSRIKASNAFTNISNGGLKKVTNKEVRKELNNKKGGKMKRSIYKSILVSSLIIVLSMNSFAAEGAGEKTHD